MTAEEPRLPSRPSQEASPLPIPRPPEPEEQCQASDEVPPFPISPPPMPWPRVFPSL